MDSEITESEKNAEELELLVTPADETEDGKEVTKKVKASFKLGSQLPRHTRSDKFFGTLYNEDRLIALIQPAALWAHDSKMNTWSLSNDGPRINVLGQFKSYEDAVKFGFRAMKIIKKKGYQMYPTEACPTKSWLVMRRYAPQNVPDDETLAANIIYFAQRKIKLQEEDFAEEIRQKERPLIKPQERPKSLESMYPRAFEDTKQAEQAIVDSTKAKLKALRKKLGRKEYLKAKAKATKAQYRQLKGLIGRIPTKARDPSQRFAAIAWLTSPKYTTLDEDTKYYGRKATDCDPAPDKVYSAEDFDEAMLVNVLQTFETQDECLEFIDNKAKHDLEYCNVTCIVTNESVPLDTVLTQAFREKIPRGYHTELQQQVIVEKEKMNKSALETAKNNPDMVHELYREDGKTVLKPSRATLAIADELAKEKEKTDKLYQESLEKLENLDINDAEDVDGVVEGGANKDETPREQTEVESTEQSTNNMDNMDNMETESTLDSEAE